jgi:type II secretory pathway component PulF
VSGVPFSNFTAREENAANYVGALTYPVIVLGLIVFFVLLSLRSGRAAARR